MYENCGTVIDWWKSYVQPEWVSYAGNLTDSDVRDCLNVYVNYLLGGNQQDCNCPLACDEVDYKPMFFRSKVNGQKEWRFEISYKTPHIITITEEELYSLKNLVADVGAMLGLLSGISVLSIVEIFVCVGLSVALLGRH